MTILPRDSVWHAITDRFWDAGSLVLARANDRIPVKLVAIVYRKPPQAIFCREESDLRKLKDLEGNAIGTTAGASVPTLFRASPKPPASMLGRSGGSWQALRPIQDAAHRRNARD